MTRFNSDLTLKDSNDVELGKNLLTKRKKGKEKKRERERETHRESLCYISL